MESMGGHKIFYYHGNAEIFLNDTWIKLTPAFDSNTALKFGYLPMCEFDGKHDSVFPRYDNNGNLFVEYVKDRGICEVLPLDEIELLFREKYADYREQPEQN